ncbi:class I SAM-dependent methyltransferase [Egicoccus sp. AB-alg2]|uniref:class I SAM-dependent methyltransferase n=1 Tax=Egicoccus sp. AB-alg2 TaxID=3242693 RepID=UPI00359DC0D7
MSTEPHAGAERATPRTSPDHPAQGPAPRFTAVGDGGFDHGGVSRFNAWFFDAFDGYINHIARPHKQAAFAGLQGPTVLELGAGVGANLDYLPAGTRLIAVEPSLRMHARLREKAATADVEVTLLSQGAEALPLDDASVDEVICSLVLCTVGDPTRVLAEVHRVLRPGGRFRFVEHVAAPTWSPRRWLQRVIRRPWAWLFEGCTLDRDTAAAVRAAGFAEVQIEQRRFRHSAFVPVNTTIWGVATR